MKLQIVAANNSGRVYASAEMILMPSTTKAELETCLDGMYQAWLMARSTGREVASPLGVRAIEVAGGNMGKGSGWDYPPASQLKKEKQPILIANPNKNEPIPKDPA